MGSNTRCREVYLLLIENSLLAGRARKEFPFASNIFFTFNKNMTQKTLIILKPDCMEKNLAGTVLSRFEAAGLTLAACKMIRITDALVREHYAHLVNEPFFGFLSTWMMSRPVIVAVLQGENAIEKVRELLGPTKSANAPAGTIRGDFGDKEVVTYNICHASDGEASAAAEIARFFGEGEVF